MPCLQYFGLSRNKQTASRLMIQMMATPDIPRTITHARNAGRAYSSFWSSRSLAIMSLDRSAFWLLRVPPFAPTARQESGVSEKDSLARVRNGTRLLALHAKYSQQARPTNHSKQVQPTTANSVLLERAGETSVRMVMVGHLPAHLYGCVKEWLYRSLVRVCEGVALQQRCMCVRGGRYTAALYV